MKSIPATKFKETEIGLIPEGWEFKVFSDLTINFDSKRKPLSSMQRSKRHGVFPYYGASGIVDYIDDYVFGETLLLISEDGENLKTRKTAIAFFADGKYWVNNHAHVIKNKPNVDLRFIKYWFDTNPITPYLSGSVQPKLSRSNLDSIEILIPKFSEQKQIAEILSSLDDKIELNRKINANLEKLAGSLFKKWFVDIGDELPEGWRISTVGKELETFLGGTPSREKSDFWTDGTIPWINSGKVNEFRITEPTELITKDALENSAAKLLPKGTVVLAITGATLGQYSLLEIDSAFNQSVVGIKENQKLKKEYIYFWIATTIKDLINAQTGGAQQHINKQVVDEHKILIPGQSLLDKYYEVAIPVFEMIGKNCFEIKNLKQIRDSLLPRLMSGKIRVNI